MEKEIQDIATQLEEELKDTGGEQAEPKAETTPAEPEPKPAEEAPEPEKDAEPSAEQAPVTEPVPAEPAPAAEPQPEPLILGKFKTQADLEKAYKSLEKRFTEKSQQVSEIIKTESDDFDKMVAQQISNATWDLVNKAVNTISDPNNYKEAVYELNLFQRTGDVAHLEKARGFLDPRVDRRLEVDAMNASAAIRQEANAHRDDIELQPVREALIELDQEYPDWMADATHQDILVEAIKLNRKVDVRGVKSLIDAAEQAAVERYKASIARKQAVETEKTPAVSIKAAERAPLPEKEKPFYEMTTAEQLKKEFEQP